MSERKNRVEGNQTNISDGNFHGAITFGPNSTAYVGSVAPGDLEQLRAEVQELREHLDQQPDGDEVEKARGRTEDLAGELGKAEPDGKEVRSRWAKLAPLAKALGAAASEGTIGALVENLF